MAEIAIRALRKAFDGAEVLKGVDLTIENGEFISLVGPSGCGKSTLLRIIAGLEPQSSGEIWIDGVSADGVRPSARNLAMVFQSYALYPHLSVFDNIAVPLRMKRLSALERAPLVGRLLPGRRRTERIIREDVERVADQLEIMPLLKRKPGQLSGGQRQRVAVGRAIVRQPRAFLFDEPLSNLATADHIPGSHEPPDYSHVTVGAGQVVIHQCSFLYAGPLFSLQDRDALEWINR